MTDHEANDIERFTTRWRGVAVLSESSELTTAQSFVTELHALLGVPSSHHAEDYQVERPITIAHGDCTTSPGRIDCCEHGPASAVPCA